MAQYKQQRARSVMISYTLETGEVQSLEVPEVFTITHEVRYVDRGAGDLLPGPTDNTYEQHRMTFITDWKDSENG